MNMNAKTPQGIAPFQYDTLPDAGAYIRLLQVLGDEDSKDIKIRCRITVWPLDNTPPYCAISYTWGDANSCSTIIVNDQAFRVRTNCEFILKQAYWYEQSSYYWVDAICINQENLAEKSLQVSRMGSIYKQAVKVLACVGDHAGDSPFLVHKLKERPFTKRLFRLTRFVRISLRFTLRQRFATTVRFLNAAFRFLERPYFTRLWILQELRRAREVTFLCGSDAVPGRAIHDMAQGILSHTEFMPDAGEFASFATSLSIRLLLVRRFLTAQMYRSVHRNDSEDEKILQRTALRAYLMLNGRVDMFSLQRAAKGLQCQERKDKIFGLIALIDWAAEARLVPDYTQTELDVAVAFFKALLSHWYQGKRVSLRSLNALSAIVAGNLKLDSNSIGVPDEIRSRQIELGENPQGGNANTKYPRTRHKPTRGWRVTGQYLTKNEAGFLTWKPSGSNKWKVHLPIWAKDGDWILVTGWPYGDLETRFVLVTEDDEGFGGPLAGRAVSAAFDHKNMDGADFRIRWDPDDLVISSIVNQEMPWGEFDGVFGQYSAEWVRALNTTICKKDMPGSSYAFRCDAVLCGHEHHI